MYDENLTSADIEDKMDEISYCIDELEGVASNLERIDKKYFKDTIGTLNDVKADLEMEYQGLEEELNEKIADEEKEGNEEMQAMNWEFERSRV